MTDNPRHSGSCLLGSGLQTGDCLALLAQLAPESVHLTVTSPPYDDLRHYDTPAPLDLPALGEALFRVTKPGGVCAVVIQDASHRHAKSLTSFRLALDWCDRAGWKLFETCIYHRHAAPGAWWRTRFRVDHEFVLLFLKGDKPRAFHKGTLLIPAKHAGQPVSRKSYPRRGTPGGAPPATVQPLKCRGTVWPYAPSNAEGNRVKLEHPATMPDALAGDLIACFSEAGDVVLDPLMGSGTSCVMARRLGRRFVGMDVSARYVGIARRRLEAETDAEDSSAEDSSAEDSSAENLAAENLAEDPGAEDLHREDFRADGFRHAQAASGVASGNRHE